MVSISWPRDPSALPHNIRTLFEVTDLPEKGIEVLNIPGMEEADTKFQLKDKSFKWLSSIQVPFSKISWKAPTEMKTSLNNIVRPISTKKKIKI